MKLTPIPFVLTLLTLCAALRVAPSCVTSHTDPHALFPPLELAWPAVQEDVHIGISDAVTDGELTEVAAVMLRTEGAKLGDAIHAKSVYGVRAVPWSTLVPYGERGIDAKLEAGEVGPGVADSLREQLVNFTEAVDRLKGSAP